MTAFVLRAVFAALGLWLATEWVDGIAVDSAATLLMAGLLLGVVNATVRPLLMLLTLPLALFTLGFFLLVINAWMVGLVAWMLDGVTVAGFWPALWTSIIISLAGMLGNALFGQSREVRIDVRRGPRE
ncbi:MAG: phage holin family protein [Gammaproteobacteria bacterium]